MGLARLKEALYKAQAEKCVVGNFDVLNIEMLNGVMNAAKKTKSPIILAYGEGFEDHVDVRHFAKIKILISMAEIVSVSVVGHCDHAVSLDELKKVMDCGFSSVMLDASDKSYEINVLKNT